MLFCFFLSFLSASLGQPDQSALQGGVQQHPSICCTISVFNGSERILEERHTGQGLQPVSKTLFFCDNQRMTECFIGLIFFKVCSLLIIKRVIFQFRGKSCHFTMCSLKGTHLITKRLWSSQNVFYMKHTLAVKSHGGGVDEQKCKGSNWNSLVTNKI